MFAFTPHQWATASASPAYSTSERARPPDSVRPSGQGIGAEVGPYRLLEQIGEGGMGLVFLAEQRRPVRRQVALKLLKPGMDSRHVLARFEAERQALACKKDPMWNLYRREEDGPPRPTRPEVPTPPPGPAPSPNWGEKLRLYAAQASPGAVADLAARLGLPAHVFRLLPVGFQAVSCAGPVWFFPERDASAHVIGLQRRYGNGDKRNLGRRGLCLVPGWSQFPGPVFCVEGASDTLALHAMNLCAVGRPSNTGGVALLAELLGKLPADRPLVVVGERDESERGWPGRDGAIQVALELGRALGRPVRWALPPEGSKDVRAWAVARQMDPTVADEWVAAGDELSALLLGASKPADGVDLFGELPLRLDAGPDVPPFPLRVFPAELARYAAELASALGCPADYVAVPMLALAGAALGGAWRVRLTASHTQSAALFAAVVGPPGSVKSPALAAVAAPLHEANGRWLDESHEQRERAALLGVKLACAPRRCVMDDFTTESLPGVLLGNPKGVAVIKDELAGLIHGLNQYKGGKGSDRQVLLAVWAGADIVVDRKSSAGPVHVPAPFVAIVGGIQPAVLAALRPKRRDGAVLDDGLLDRFLFAYPEPPPALPETWKELSAEAGGCWRSAVTGLLRAALRDGALHPRELPLGETGRAEWEAFTLAHAAEANHPDVALALGGVWSKMRGYCARVALVLQALRWVCGETGEEKQVDGVSVRGAAEVIAYFKAHARKVHGAIQTDPVQAGAEKVARWLEERPSVARFTRGELYQHLRRQFTRPAQLDEPLALLADLRYVRPVPGPTHEWMVNPLWRRE